MSDTLRQGSDQSSPSAVNEATFLGGILRKGELVGGWEITSKIAVTSGEAELYLATKDGIVGVVKYYRNPGFQPKDEVLTTLSSWKHEDVINLLGSGRYNGLFFEAMEYAAGGALNSQNEDGCFKYLPLSEENTLHMIKEVTNAFHACHEAGIIHRDIKPANIFYRNADGTDFVIGDFGISSQLDTAAQLSSRMTQNINRTEGYAGPEIYSGVITKAVDYYALGITVWEVLTGKSAFEGRNQSLISRDTIEGRIIDDLLGRSESATLGEHIKTLIKGLLTHRHDKRWGYEQIQAWFGGNDVPVYNQLPEMQVKPFKSGECEGANLLEVSQAILSNPEPWKKVMNRGYIDGWLIGFDQKLAERVKEIRENLGELESNKALRRIALELNPGQPFMTADGKAIDSFFDLKQLIETEPEALLEHLRNMDDVLWDYFEMWGCGPAFEALKPRLGNIKSQKRLVSMVIVALNGNIIKPFEDSKYKGMELSMLGQLSALPKDCQKRFLMELEDKNGLLCIWLENLLEKGIPEEWDEDQSPSWEDVLAWTQGKEATEEKRFLSINNEVYSTVYNNKGMAFSENQKIDFYESLVEKAGFFSIQRLDTEISNYMKMYAKEQSQLAIEKKNEEECFERKRRENDKKMELLRIQENEKLRLEQEEKEQRKNELIFERNRQVGLKIKTLIHTLVSIFISIGFSALGIWVFMSFPAPLENPFNNISWIHWVPAASTGKAWTVVTIIVVAIIGAIIGIATDKGFWGFLLGAVLGAALGWLLAWLLGFVVAGLVWVALLIPNGAIALFFLLISFGKWFLFGIPIILGAVSALFIVFSMISIAVQIFLKPEAFTELASAWKKIGGVYGLLISFIAKRKNRV